jgi:hypothetical protein
MIGKYMMATKAGGNPKSAKVIDISRDEPDLMHVDGEDGDYWVGHWIEGMGFINVYFPKTTTRPCTPDEITHFLRMRIGIPGVGYVPLREQDFRMEVS